MQGDFEALRKLGRRAVRLHLGSDVARSSEEPQKLVRKVLEKIR